MNGHDDEAKQKFKVKLFEKRKFDNCFKKNNKIN